MRQLQILKAVTHGWGEGKDHKRLVLKTGRVVNVPDDLPMAEAEHLRAKELARWVTPAPAPDADMASAPTPLTAAPTRPGGLADRVRPA